MKPRDELLGNPFAALGASPRDSRARLIELADEAVLFGDASANDQLNQLLQPGSRLEAELRWFPGTDTEEAEKVLEYARKDVIAPVPGFHTDSTLARFNACRLFLSYWPVRSEEDALALCKSLIIAEQPVNADRAAWEVRGDRKRSGIVGEIDREAVAERLEELRHSAAQQALAACGELNAQDRAAVFNRLAENYGSEDALYHFNPFVVRLVEAYALTVEEDVRHCVETINRLKKDIRTRNTAINQAIQWGGMLATQTERWAALYGPTLVLQAARQSVPQATREFLTNLVSLTEWMTARFFEYDQANTLCHDLLKVCEDILRPVVPVTRGIDVVNRLYRARLLRLADDKIGHMTQSAFKQAKEFDPMMALAEQVIKQNTQKEKKNNPWNNKIK